ncbi:hypothetical protein NQZ68_033096 [Dissostichus eleginoides]|nr:hypothetical protein NQZ68_033096 [Dissostichus eleginoides]
MTETSESSLSFCQIRTNSEQRSQRTAALGQKERMLRDFLPVKRVLAGYGNPTFRIYPVQKVKVQHKEKMTNRQSFKLRQEAEEISVTMWDEATEQSKDLSFGDVLLLTNMKPNEYCGKVSLNSTQFTKSPRYLQPPIKGIKEATLKETQLEVDLDTKPHTLVVASRLQANTLDFQLKKGFGDDLLERIPLSVEAEIQGNRIIKMADPENI